MKKILMGVVLVAVSSTAFARNELAENVGAAVGGAVGATYGGPAGAAAGNLAGRYGTRAVDSAVSSQIDRHFDRRDQAFANRTGITVEYPDRGVTIRPQNRSR